MRVKQSGGYIMKTKNREEQLAYLRGLKDEDIDYSG